MKVLRPGIARPQALSRFAHDAETPGQLQHPGFAQDGPEPTPSLTPPRINGPWHFGMLTMMGFLAEMLQLEGRPPRRSPRPGPGQARDR